MVNLSDIPLKSRRMRDLIEKFGYLGLGSSALIGLLFLCILVWQILAPTVINGVEGEISAVNEYIPETEFILEWDNPNWDPVTEEFLTNEIILELKWKDENGSHSYNLEIKILEERYIEGEVYVSNLGISNNIVNVSKKTHLSIYSNLEYPVEIKQIKGPVPKADEVGLPEAGNFVVTADFHILFDDENKSVFTVQDLFAWSLLLIITLIIIYPKEGILQVIERGGEQKKLIWGISILFSLISLFGKNIGFKDSGWKGYIVILIWISIVRSVFAIRDGVKRLKKANKPLSNKTALSQSISNREGLLLGNYFLLFFGLWTIPIEIDAPFLVERYQNIFQPYSSGIRAAFFGTIWVMSIAMVVSLPVSVGAAIYLEEYAKPTRLTKLIQALVTNLAGVPSIVFGMFGLAIFVKEGGFGWGLGQTVIAGGLTMGVMAMPIVVLASQEALRSVPKSIREAAFGIGCTKWKVVRDHVLPFAIPGILTGSILAMSRIMGEAAPLIVVGAASVIYFDPEPFAAFTGSKFVNFTVVPVQIYQWTGLEGDAWKSMTAAASLALIMLLVGMNSIAIILRQHFRKRLLS